MSGCDDLVMVSGCETGNGDKTDTVRKIYVRDRANVGKDVEKASIWRAGESWRRRLLL